jgi:hypothetical protein
MLSGLEYRYPFKWLGTGYEALEQVLGHIVPVSNSVDPELS